MFAIVDKHFLQIMIHGVTDVVVSLLFNFMVLHPGMCSHCTFDYKVCLTASRSVRVGRILPKSMFVGKMPFSRV